MGTKCSTCEFAAGKRREAWQTDARRKTMKLSLFVMTIALLLATIAGQGALV